MRMLACSLALLSLVLMGLSGCSDAEGGGDCTPSCGAWECGSDGCGGVCGTCDLGELCSGVGSCLVAADCTDTCEGVSASCGTVCGQACGACGDGQSCAGVTCVDVTDDGGGGFSTGEALGVSAYPDPVLFPNIALGESTSRIVTVEHTGDSGNVELKSITLDPLSDELALELPEVMSLAPGETLDVTLVFTPQDDASYSGTLLIATNVQSTSGETVTLALEVETPSPTAEFMALPNPMDFGQVAIGTSGEGVVQLIPLGSDSAQVTAIAIEDNASGEFALVDPVALPATATPTETFDIQVAYTPVDGTADSATLYIEFAGGGEVMTESVALIGSAISPGLELFPDPVDFGWQSAGQSHTIPMTLSNSGTVALVVTKLDLTTWSSGTLSLEGVPALPMTIEPTDLATVQVVFTPTLDMEQTTGPIGGVHIESNATDGQFSQDGSYVVDVFGRAEAPVLVVTPPESLDFANVALGLESKRTVTLSNQGSAPLTVTSVTLEDAATGEFTLVNDASWGPLSASPTPGEILPGELKSVDLVFSNDGVNNAQDVFAKLRIISDDGAKPDWQVNLVAHRVDAASCDIQLTPVQSDFGIVPRGFTKTVTVNVTNIGSGPCSFDSAFVNDCDGWGGFFGTSCPDPSGTIQVNGDSAHYDIVTHPPAFLNGLKPGEVHEIKVMFTPPDTAPLFGDEFMDYAGFLGVRVKDPYPPANGDVVIFPKPQGAGSSAQWPANLHARSGMAELTVFPGELDFGMTTLGCHSQTLELTACNVGNAPLDLTDAQLEGCSVEFKQKAYPGLPVTMEPQQCEAFTLVYVPQDLGSDACSMSFTTNNADVPSVIVPIAGEGVLETEQTDVFVQLTGQDVDVLFVVDDSGSMGEEQSNLASNFSQFINEASTWQNNYNVGVTTMDVDAVGGRLKGSPRIVTPATWQSFQNNVQVGTNGSGTERGLNAAQLALTLPNIADSSLPCATDAECVAPDACYDGFCGGPNRGFLREDATLEIVFVSDEEDQSTADLNFYINFFKNIKGFYNSNLLHVHAIVGPPGGCSSSNGDATQGMRYIDVANATGGNVASICQSDFADSLASIGEIAFGLKTQFFLSRSAIESTIEVRINGVLCGSNNGSNWTYEALSNSVLFVEDGGCMPQAGDEIEIYYETLCFLE